jgi:hypothetical protein
MDVERSAGTLGASEATELGKKKQSSIAEDRSIGHGENDLLGGEKVDAVLAAKMILVNDVSPMRELLGHFCHVRRCFKLTAATFAPHIGHR